VPIYSLEKRGDGAVSRIHTSPSGDPDAIARPISDLAEALDATVRQARALIASDPGNSHAYRQLAAALRRLGRHEEAGRAEVEAIQVSAGSPQLLEAARAMRARQIEAAERLLRSFLDVDPDDPQALRMLAEIAAVTGHGGEAERLLCRALDEVPGFIPLHVNLATLWHDLGRTDDAIELLDRVLSIESGNAMVLSFKAEILAGADRMNEALDAYEKLLTLVPEAAVVWMNYGQALTVTGRIPEAIAAYRKSLHLNPNSGLAWWRLASLRATKLDEGDIAGIQRALAGASDDLNRVQLHFALGKALGDQAHFEQSFNHYAIANEIRRTIIPTDVRRIEEAVDRTQALFTPEFLDRRMGEGCPAANPIFIVGLPRSGTTLVEQILASHPLVEGMGELVDLEVIGARVAGQKEGASWLQSIGELSADDRQMLGESYLQSTRVRRKTGRPFFTDKMPSNWAYAGLIHLIFPNARIIDVRRHPLACCVSNFALYFNRETSFASSLEELGRYYRAYVQMMAHFDRVLPGRIHRMLYEGLVQRPEEQVRKLLAHLGLPFEEGCLRFHENPRAVHTPSAQQVRRPISGDRFDHWRNYDPWLGPLKEALGPVLDLYPGVPDGLLLK
jgi:tetratricopeptide (TPR) repeat protein